MSTQVNQKYNRIKVELAEAGKQNGQLAVFLGVHASTVSDWCTNTNQPSIQDLYRIADFLKVDVRNLLVPNQPKPDTYITGQESLQMVSENETTYKRKTKPARSATAKQKGKPKKPR